MISQGTIRGLLALLIAASTVAPLRAQDAVEGIVAIVGREIILKSDVDGQLEVMSQRDPKMNKKDPEIRKAILDQLINERLMVTKAIEDSVDVQDDEITQRMEYQIQMLVQQYGSEKRIEDLYGMSMSRIRKDFRDEIRKRLLVEKIQGAKFGDVKASRSDVEAFFVRYKDSIPQVNDRVDLYHIVKYVTASTAKNKEAQLLAIRVRDSIIKGGSFSDFARRYSGDPVSAANGGDLGTVEKGKFVPAFESAAFALESNEISQPVETPFGWHVIQLVGKTSSTITCRHILIRVGQSDEDRDAVKKTLAEIRDRVKAGEDFEALAKKYSEEKETQGFGGAMGQIDMQRLPDDMKRAILTMNDGDVTEPLPYAADPTKPGFHIMWRKKFIKQHYPTLEDDYKQLEQMASMEKRQRLEQEWMKELRKKLYWEVR